MPKMPQKTPSKSAEILAGSSASLLPDLTSVSKGGDVGVPKKTLHISKKNRVAMTLFLYFCCVFFQGFAGCF